MSEERLAASSSAVDHVIRLFQSLLQNRLTDDRSATSVFDKTEQLASAAQIAVAQARNDWNRRAGNTVSAIPREIWASILLLVPLPDRIAVLRVSRDLRELALTNPTIWASGHITDIVDLQFIRMHSGSAPLDLELLVRDDEDPLLSAICDDVQRIRRLDIAIPSHPVSSEWPVMNSIFNRHLPLLEDFRFNLVGEYGYTGLPIIAPPANFANLAPRLRTLVTSVAVDIPENMGALVQMKNFSVILPEGATRNRLFAVLPNVQSLSLIGGRGVLPHGRPPHSLLHLRLATDRRVMASSSREYTEALSQWGQHALQGFEIEVDGHERFRFALDLFDRCWHIDRPFALKLYLNDLGITVNLDRGLKIQATESYFVKAANTLRAVSVSSPTWNHLSNLTIDRHALLAIIHAELAFAGVTDLTLIVNVLSSYHEHQLMSIDWRRHLTNAESGTHRTLSLPSLQHVHILQPETPMLAAAINRLLPLQPRFVGMQARRRPLPQLPGTSGPAEDGGGPTANISYGHGPVDANIDRGVQLVSRLGPQVLKHHISRGSNGAELMLASIRISIARETMDHSVKIGVELSQGYEGLALVCNVDLSNDGVANSVTP